MGRSSNRAARGRRGGGQAPADGRWLAELAAIASDPARWAALDEDTLLLIVYQQCLHFAHTRAPEAAEALARLVPELAARVAPPGRIGLLERVSEAVEEGGVPVLALLPFLQHDTDPATVSLAAQSFASLAPVDANDELAGPRTLARLVELAEGDGTRAGLLAGLLALGDRRVLPLALGAWQRLTPEARIVLASMPPATPMVFAAGAEFWLGALEDAEGEAFAAAAGALARLALRAEPRRVLDVRRNFPANGPDERETLEVLADVPLERFALALEPRLRDLQRREGAPARIPAVLAAWGLGPTVPGRD